jgi:hypothetical protein
MEPEGSLPYSLQPATSSLSWARLIQSTLPPNFLRIHFSIIFPSTSRSSKWRLSLRFPHQNPVFSPYFQRICPGPRLSTPFHNIFSFYGKELLSFRPTPNLDGCTCRLSATAYSIYWLLSSIHNLRMGHAAVRGTHLSWSLNRYSLNLIMYNFTKNLSISLNFPSARKFYWPPYTAIYKRCYANL